MGGVTITELIDKMGLRNMTPELETDNVMLVHADVNRPALQLTGFFDHFDKDRVQIIGYVENAYISTLTPQRRREMFDKLLSSGIPCLVYSRGMAPEEEVLELCNHYGVPCMVSEKTTSDLMAEIILLAERQDGADDQHSRRTGRCIWQRVSYYGRERYRQE